MKTRYTTNCITRKEDGGHVYKITKNYEDLATYWSKPSESLNDFLNRISNDVYELSDGMINITK